MIFLSGCLQRKMTCRLVVGACYLTAFDVFSTSLKMPI